jgi:pyruvate dehydrogenase E1 component
VVGVLSQLVREKKINKKVIQAAIDKYKLDDVSAADPGNTEGSG